MRRRRQPRFDEEKFWIIVVIAAPFIVFALLAWFTAGCATVPQAQPLCTTDGRPVIPHVETRFISMKLKVACNNAPMQANTAELTFESSMWIWTAISAIGSALVTAVVAERGPSDGRTVLVDRRPATRGPPLAPRLRADEGDPPWLLWPPVDPWWPALATRH